MKSRSLRRRTDRAMAVYSSEGDPVEFITPSRFAPTRQVARTVFRGTKIIDQFKAALEQVGAHLARVEAELPRLTNLLEPAQEPLRAVVLLRVPQDIIVHVREDY